MKSSSWTWMMYKICETFLESSAMTADSHVNTESSGNGDQCYFLSLSVNYLLIVSWLLDVLATCNVYMSTKNLLWQLYMLPHWDRRSRSNLPSHPVTLYWCWTSKSYHRPFQARCITGKPTDCKLFMSAAQLDQGQQGAVPLSLHSRLIPYHLVIEPVKTIKKFVEILGYMEFGQWQWYNS